MTLRPLLLLSSASVAVLALGSIAYATGGEAPDAAALAAEQPSDDPTDEPTDDATGDATDRPTADPTDEPSDRPTPDGTSSPAGTTAGTSTHDVPGVGTVTISVEGTQVTVLSATAHDASWRVVIETDEPHEAEVSFRSPDRRIDWKAEVEDGQLRVRIRDRASDDATATPSDDASRREEDASDDDELDDRDDDSLDEDSDDSLDEGSEDSASDDSLDEPSASEDSDD